MGSSGISGFYRVLNYPMGALIELETLLIVSLDEGEIEGRKGEHSRAAKQGREGTTTSAEPGTRVSDGDICTRLDLNFTLHQNMHLCVFLGAMLFQQLTLCVF